MFGQELERWRYTDSRWIYEVPKTQPTIDTDRGVYLPRLRTPIVDSYDNHWAVWLDPRDLQPLHLEYRESYQDVSYKVFPLASRTRSIKVQAYRVCSALVEQPPLCGWRQTFISRERVCTTQMIKANQHYLIQTIIGSNWRRMSSTILGDPV